MLLTFFVFSPLCPLLCFPQYPLCILLAFISITIMLYFSQLVPHFLLCHVLSLIVSNYSCFVVFPHRQLFTTFWCIVFNLNQCFNYNFYLLQGNTSPTNIHCCCSVTKSRPTVCDPISSVQFSSVQFSDSVTSDSLQPHGLQHARLPCPSATPGACSNSSPLSRWCHPTISSSVILFNLSQHQGFFLRSQLFTSGGQSIGVSASTSVLPMNIQDWSPLGWTGWISLQFKALSRFFSSTTVQKHQFFDT